MEINQLPVACGWQQTHLVALACLLTLPLATSINVGAPDALTQPVGPRQREGGRGHGWAVLGRPPDILGSKADDGARIGEEGREAEGGDTPERGRIE